MKLIGLTGPSGAGKGEVARILASFGLAILDADEIYHSLILPGMPCTRAIAEAFGAEVLNPDGSLNRPALGKIVFSDVEKLGTLNSIAHRYVLAEMKRRLSLLPSTVPAAVFDAPQLFESGADKDCDSIVSVLADPAIRVRRVMERDHISEEAARSRISAQKSDAFFREHSDAVLENNGELSELIPAIRKILRESGVIPS